MELAPNTFQLQPVSLQVSPVPIRLRLMQVIGERLARITVANGYYSELGQTIEYGQLLEYEPPTLPMINFWDQDETNDSSLYGAHEPQVVVTVEAYDIVPEGWRIPVVHNQLLADVKRALVRDQATGLVDFSCGGLAESIQYLASTMVYGRETRLWSANVSQWVLTYRELAGDPEHSMES